MLLIIRCDDLLGQINVLLPIQHDGVVPFEDDRILTLLAYRSDDLVQLTENPARQLFVFDL